MRFDLEFFQTIGGAAILDESLRWTVAAFLLAAFLFSFGRKTAILARLGYGLGTIAAILMLFSGHHLASLQRETIARTQARIQDEEAYAKRIKAQLRTAQAELMKARSRLQTAEVDVIGLEATLLDARDKLERTGHDVTAVGAKTKVKTRPIKKAVYRTIATRMPDPSHGFPEMGLARNEYFPDDLAIP